MKYRRSVIEVSIRLDPAPGWNHQPEDMVESIKNKLEGWYKPEVRLIRVDEDCEN